MVNKPLTKALLPGRGEVRYRLTSHSRNHELEIAGESGSSVLVSPNAPWGRMHIYLLPRKLTWNLKINPLKRKIIFQTFIFGFHVSFRGCIPPGK